MILQVFETFLAVLGRCASMLFQLPISDGVSFGSFLVAAAVLGVIITVVFAGIREFVSLYNHAYDERQRESRRSQRKDGR